MDALIPANRGRPGRSGSCRETKVDPTGGMLRFLHWLPFLLGMAVYACGDDPSTAPPSSTEPLPGPIPATLQEPNQIELLRVCGDETAADLIAGRHITSGGVRVANDEGSLSVSFTTTDGWELRETHLALAQSLESIPRTSSGEPIPGHFEHRSEHVTGTTEFAYTVPLSSLEVTAGHDLVIAAHADLFHPGDATDPTDDQSEGGWGDGSPFVESGDGSWATYIEFAVQGCERVSQTVGVSGGVVLADAVRLDIPEGALSEDVTITVTPVDVSSLSEPPDGVEDVIQGTAFEFGPEGLQFEELVQLTIEYDEATLPEDIDENSLRMVLVGDEIVFVGASTVDAGGNVVSTLVDHFSIYALAVDPLAPIDLVIEESIKVSDEVTPLPRIELSIAETITVSDAVTLLPTIPINLTETIAVSDAVTTELEAVSGAVAYVANQGDNSVTVIDQETRSIVKTVPVGTYPYGIAARPGSDEIYVTNRGDGTVSVIDGSTDTVVTTISSGVNDPIDIAFSPDGAWAYVVDNDASLLGAIDAASRTLFTRLTGTTRFSRAIALTPASGDTAFVAAEDSLVMFDLVSGVALDTVGGSLSSRDAALTPDGMYVYVSDGTNDRVVIYDRTTLAFVDTVTGISSAAGIAMDPVQAIAYVAERGRNALATIDIATRTAGSNISLPFSPQFVAISSDGTTGYVTEGRGGSQVAIVDLTAGTVVTTLSVGSSPAGVTVPP